MLLNIFVRLDLLLNTIIWALSNILITLLYALKSNYFVEILFSHYFSTFHTYYITLLYRGKSSGSKQEVFYWHELFQT